MDPSIDRREFLKRLYTPSFIAETLRARGLSLRRRHGQNFLVSRSVAERILEHAALRPLDTVLEIGPGLGQLTFLLAERVRRVIAVEIDGGVADYLRETVRRLGVENVAVVVCDFFDGDFGASGASKVVSSFPYGIAVKAIIKILRELRDVSCVTGLVQREIAERLSAKSGSPEYSAVSVVVQYLSEIRVLERNVAPGNFFPVPEVTSAVVSVRRREEGYAVDGELFERVVKAGFARRRKTLLGNLAKAGILSDADGSRNDACGFVVRRFGNAKVRAESLTAGDFAELAAVLGGRGGKSPVQKRRRGV